MNYLLRLGKQRQTTAQRRASLLSFRAVISRKLITLKLNSGQRRTSIFTTFEGNVFVAP